MDNGKKEKIKQHFQFLLNGFQRRIDRLLQQDNFENFEDEMKEEIRGDTLELRIFIQKKEPDVILNRITGCWEVNKNFSKENDHED